MQANISARFSRHRDAIYLIVKLKKMTPGLKRDIMGEGYFPIEYFQPAELESTHLVLKPEKIDKMALSIAQKLAEEWEYNMNLGFIAKGLPELGIRWSWRHKEDPHDAWIDEEVDLDP